MKVIHIRRSITLITSTFLAAIFFAMPAKAGYPDGCVGGEDVGRTNVVGYADVGYMAAGVATVPEELIVYGLNLVSNEYSKTTFFDGVGLEAPSESMPVWLVPVEGPGTYVLITESLNCVVQVPAADVSPVEDDTFTVKFPKSAALVGVGTLLIAIIILASVLLRRRRA
jgi:hypothetical protein